MKKIVSYNLNGIRSAMNKGLMDWLKATNPDILCVQELKAEPAKFADLKMPIIVLVNKYSASAAEILAGALRDDRKIQLIGEKSFGKGSVQELVPLGANAAVKVTIAKWITPGGKNLNKDGLNPDIEVKLTEEDVKAGKDPQMDRALQEVVK